MKQIYTGDDARPQLVVRLKLHSAGGELGPQFSGIMYSILVVIGWSFTSTRLSELGAHEAKISLRSAAITHHRSPRSQTIVINTNVYKTVTQATILDAGTPFEVKCEAANSWELNYAEENPLYDPFASLQASFIIDDSQGGTAEA